MEFSVIIPAHNQQERLRLVLCALRHQTFPAADFEVIVVDDGSTDGTAQMLAGLQTRPDAPQVIRLERNVGRCKARNLGVARARGRFVAFLDGDAMPHPRWLDEYRDGFARHGDDSLLCGFKRSLPDLEFLQDPQTGTLMDIDLPSVLKERIRAKLDDIVVTEAMVANDFAGIERRALDGGYPLPELREMQEQTMELFRERPDSPLSWVAHSPHNGAMPRQAFVDAGGYDETISFSEGWELAYRLQRAGIRPRFVAGAKTYHLYHYHDHASPDKARQAGADRNAAIDYMAAKHRDPQFHLLRFWMASIWPGHYVPEEMLLYDLIEFDHRYGAADGVEEMLVMVNNHPLWGHNDRATVAA